jgi:hypothetical protein
LSAGKLNFYFRQIATIFLKFRKFNMITSRNLGAEWVLSWILVGDPREMKHHLRPNLPRHLLKKMILEYGQPLVGCHFFCRAKTTSVHRIIN